MYPWSSFSKWTERSRQNENQGSNSDEATRESRFITRFIISFRIYYCFISFFRSSWSHEGKLTELTTQLWKRIPLSASFVSAKYNVTSVVRKKLKNVKWIHMNGGRHQEKLALYFKHDSELRQVKDLEVNYVALLSLLCN